MVHRGEEDFARAAPAGLLGPCEELAVGEAAPAVGGDAPAAVDSSGVDGHRDELRAVLRRYGVDERGIGHGGAVDGDLVGAGVQEPSGVVDRGDAPADGEGDVDACGDARHQSGEGAATFGRGADVEVDQLVGTFGGVAGAQLHRIAHTAQVGEIDALDRQAVADVQAGDYSFGKHRPRSSRVIRPS